MYLKLLALIAVVLLTSSCPNEVMEAQVKGPNWVCGKETFVACNGVDSKTGEISCDWYMTIAYCIDTVSQNYGRCDYEYMNIPDNPHKIDEMIRCYTIKDPYKYPNDICTSIKCLNAFQP